jgi:hypothetical protein
MLSQLSRRQALLALSLPFLPLSQRATAEELDDFDAKFAEIRSSSENLSDASNQSEAKELARSGFAASQIDVAKSRREISSRAIELIVFFEVSSESLYQKKYRGAIWPGRRSGVTVGVGYDLGYVSEERIHEDWRDFLGSDQISFLQSVAGLRGVEAREAAKTLAGVDIPFPVAFEQFKLEVLPRYIGLTEGALAKTSSLSGDSLGALVSLTYNRGASYTISESQDKNGRYREMRAIRDHMETGNLTSIGSEIRGMVRLWDIAEFPGLHKRRNLEADLYEAGL